MADEQADFPIFFTSRKSPVLCLHGCAASSQHIASNVGIEILKSGGNAADAAIGIAAALNVTEPCQTGLGGDAFCLFYNAKDKTVHGLNGSGRCASNLTLTRVNEDGFDTKNHIPVNHGHVVTVPGAAAAWIDTVEKFGSGKIKLCEILQPAIKLAKEGVPVNQVASQSWSKNCYLFKERRNTYGSTFLIDGRTPKFGEIFKNPDLAKTFEALCQNGKKSFYEGAIAEAIFESVKNFGGVLTLEDLKNHVTTFDDPISVDYKGSRVWEIPPNGQGITALIALNILENFDLKSLKHNSAEYLHLLIEALGLAFADTRWYCADPSQVKVPIEELLSKTYAKERAKLINSQKIIESKNRGTPFAGTDTVYFTVVDNDGNACSFIASNYQGFGSGIVPKGCGFSLHNRGLGFSLERDHPNVIAPNKRPYHTIIPALVTDSNTGDLLMTYGVMGGFMQPQGHVQVLLNMLEFGMDPQQALDAPRFCIGGSFNNVLDIVSLEDGIDPEVAKKLAEMGHKVCEILKGYERSLFGRGQAISRGAWWANTEKYRITDDRRVWWAGSDSRGDGSAIGY